MSINFTNSAPLSLSEVSVHNKKVADIQNWFQKASKRHGLSILVVSGPPGCGKTNLVRIVAKNSKYEVKEWIPPVDISKSEDKADTYVNNARCGEQLPEPQMKTFLRFLANSLRYKSIISNCSKRAIIVKDLPNAILTTPSYLHDSLNEQQTHTQSSIIFIFTDSKANKINNLVNHVFPSDFCIKNSIHRVSFNPVSNSMMKKGVERFISVNQYTEFDKNFDLCTKTAHGDIRQALLSLQFSSAKDHTKTMDKGCYITQSRRDHFSNLPQTLGFILNPKCDKENLNHSIEKIVDEYSNEFEYLVRSIHRNYVPHFRSIEYLADASNFISLSDVFSVKFFDKLFPLLALSMCVRGIMAVNPNPVIGLRSARANFRK